ncbi:serine/threonine protein kinase [Tahibacter amnicola]|uniref:Serine/threonine protein kinase n=1 Tax=Tahibacter amnicola TaxID=2976241 RepID=A0ABY6BB51_9GAMM|nr:serine/threonine-protein kinase [Tahibacter amnicola]UXI65861.1 serine/threonine protein kinase [Tahibacter amnicola]
MSFPRRGRVLDVITPLPPRRHGIPVREHVGRSARRLRTMNGTASDPEDWAKLDQLLSHAIDLEESDRVVWLRDLRRDDPVVAARIERLLALADTGSVLDVLMSQPMLEGALAQFTDVSSGTRFGSWVIQRHLGVGGMAEVYLARRGLEEGEQFAALKLIATGMARPDAFGKFIREAAILSQLNDPRIARLIDTGRAEDGRPWLAMEYVDGDPLDVGCDRRGLGVRERVGLLIEVALAVDHAHRHLVVHRDIKPANVLLCADGNAIRLLDFGIAKVLAHTDQDPASATRVFTPHFASPEQLSGAPVGIASDVYQLGVLTYLLLTGTRPFRAVDQNPAALVAAMQEGAVPPSVAVLANPERQLARTGVRAERVSAILEGDLDTIVRKAMAGEPERRYLSARDLAEDLIRWCNAEAIAARPDAWYRATKRIRRHWAIVTAAALVLTLVVAYALTVTWQREALQVERDAARKALARAEMTRRFLMRVIGTANPVGAQSGTRNIKEALIEATDAVETEFRGQPEVAAEAYAELGQTFQGMEDPVNAERAFRRALDSVPAGAAPDARTVSLLAIALADLGRVDDGKVLIDQNRERIALHFGEASNEHVLALYATARVGKALLKSASDKTALEAEIIAALQRALALHNTLHPPAANGLDHEVDGVRSDIESAIGEALLRAGKMEEAVVYLRRHYGLQLRMHGPAAARTLSARMNLATTLQKLEKYAESGALLAGLVEAMRRAYGSEPNRMVAFALGALGNQARLTGAHADAAGYWASAEAEAAGAMGADHPWLGTARFRQAEALALDGRREEAIAMLEELTRRQGRTDDLVTRASALLASTREGGAR